MNYACAHRLRRENEIIGASGAQEWSLTEPDAGIVLPPLDCFFPIGNEHKLYGSLDVWLFRTKEIEELGREEWIGTITFASHIARQYNCWVGNQKHIMMRIYLDGHGADTGNRCKCGMITPVGWDECQKCWGKTFE